MTTNFSNQVEILAQLYINYKDDKALEEFFQYNDLGLPLAFLATENLCDITDIGKSYISETWDMFIASLGIEDKGFTLLDELFELAAEKDN